MNVSPLWYRQRKYEIHCQFLTAVATPLLVHACDMANLVMTNPPSVELYHRVPVASHHIPLQHLNWQCNSLGWMLPGMHHQVDYCAATASSG
jgi:hypothetical protein